MSLGGRYLREPLLFPARRAGEAWGADEVSLGIAGASYDVVGLSVAQSNALRERFGGFVRGRQDGAMRIEVLRASEGDFRDLLDPAGAHVLELESAPDTLRIAGREVMALVEWSASAAALWVARRDDPIFAFACENVLRALVAYRLLEMGGVLLHSAAVADKGRAFVFAGRSGAGKSTISRLSRDEGRGVIGDDLNAVLPGPHGPVVVPVPFGSDFRGRPGPAYPLAAFVTLRKGPAHARAPQPRAALAARLLVCAPYVNQDASRTEALLDVCQSLAGAVPAHVLTFAVARGVWTVLDPAEAA